MKMAVTVQKCLHLWWFLSTAVLHSVSAGGAYCAKTARARAAALGLDYPGVHGAPDFSAAPASLLHPKTFSFDDLAPGDSNMDFYKDNQQVEAPFYHPLHKKPHPRGYGRFPSSHGPFVQASMEHVADRTLGFPRGHPVREPQSGLREVKRVAPPTLAKAPSIPESMNIHPQGRREPLPFSHSKANPAGDEFAPNRRGMALTGLALPLSRGHAAYQTGIHPETEVPFLHSARRLHRRRGWTPMGGLWKAVWRPGPPDPSLRKRAGVSPFVQGRGILRSLRKTK